MKTKYGEIKSIKDFFIGGRVRVYNKNAEMGCEVWLVDMKCKLCGDKIEMITEDSAQNLDDEKSLYNPENLLVDHIKLHQTINNLGEIVSELNKSKN